MAYEKVNTREARQLAADGAALIDVRDPAMFARGHIEGAVSLPLYALGGDAAARVIGPRDRAVVVYCQAGVLSAMAAQALVGLGYEQVYDLGGVGNWPDALVTE